MFSVLSEITIMALVCEIFQKRFFKQGDVVLTQSAYSPTNIFSQEYYGNTHVNNKFLEKIKTKKLKFKKRETFFVVNSARRN